MSDKLCINCRHYDAAQNAEYDNCLREQKYDLVRGDKIGSSSACCYLERSHNWLKSIVLDTCGKSARFYAPKSTGPTYMRLWECHCAEIAKAEGEVMQ